ncbi:MAG TPA: BamA/TamA family outer membrane protein, partial [Bacteroidota bacterium]|nr:BamA/TamA family outer membrane protein [Bacteroidota bacterium]
PPPEHGQLFEVDKIQFKGNDTYDAGVLRKVITMRETPGSFSQFFYRTFGEKLGSKPEYFDKPMVDADLQRLGEFYQRHGFYQTIISNEFIFDTSRYRVNILFTIQENKRSFIDSVRYSGLEGVPAHVRENIFQDPVLQVGMPYESDAASAEINRILTILMNNGYPAARLDRDSSYAGHHRFSTNNFILKYVFVTGDLRRFGNVLVHVEPPRDDIVDNLVVRQLDFEPGDLYSREKIISSEGNLNRLGLFETATIDSSSARDSLTASNIPMTISVRPRPRNELSPEFIVSDENNALNLGVGLGYTNHNFFGDARTFTARVRARTQSIRELLSGRGFRDTTVIGAVNLEFEILQPYLFTRTLSGSWTSSISAEKQKLYILSILRNKIGLSNKFAEYTYGFLDWTLERVKTEFLLDTLQLQSIIKTQRQEDQFNSILTFTLQRDKTNDIFSPTEGFFNSITLEESGILPKLLPGIVSGLPFTQYYKITLFERWYQDLTPTRFNVLAIKLKSGYQDKYGESRDLPVSIPLNRRFFSGGSGSVRGWRARELGAMPDELLQFGGNFIFEGSAEMRVNHFRGFGQLGFLRLESVWAVYFLDFGNVWSDISDFKPRDIAVAAGLGIRYETFFGPFRIDYGFRVYDPKELPGRKSIFQKQFFGETLGNAVVHIGIGHAF